MINLEPTITTVKKLLKSGSDADLSYAALECRLAIERICYERLRIAHDYISHDDLKRWQPSNIVKTLLLEVDTKVAETFTFSISKAPVPKNSTQLTKSEYEAFEYVPVGTQIGFKANKMAKLWNALAKLALHVEIPKSKDSIVSQYGDPIKIRAKVEDALNEIVRISKGTLTSSGFGEEISFVCKCGATNRRRFGLLQDQQIVSCIKPDCNESYEYQYNAQSFARRIFEITCQRCQAKENIPKNRLEKLRNDQNIKYICAGCNDEIILQWRPMQAQKTKLKTN